MPSAEKVTSAATKLEMQSASEQKGVENTQKENALDQNEKSVPAIQQVISIISNKVRNLEKRKVSFPLFSLSWIWYLVALNLGWKCFVFKYGRIRVVWCVGSESHCFFSHLSLEQTRWLRQRRREWQGVEQWAAESRFKVRWSCSTAELVERVLQAVPRNCYNGSKGS